MTTTLIYAFQATIPALSTQAAPYTFAMTMPVVDIQTVEWTVPPGNRGASGWALGSAGVRIIPFNPGGWIVADGYSGSWDVEGQFDSGAWEFFGYNTGFWPHTVYLRFICTAAGGDVAAPAPPVITEDQISTPVASAS